MRRRRELGWVMTNLKKLRRARTSVLRKLGLG
jgi:hypothetical protein